MESLEPRELLAVQPVGVVVAPTPLGGIAANNLVVATFTSQDDLGNVSNFAATVNWGDGSSADPSTSIVFIGPVASLGDQYEVVAASHTFGNSEIGQTLNVAVTIHDDNDATNSVAESTVTVGDSPIAATGVSLPGNVTAGTPMTAVPLAHFTDPNTTVSASNFTANINWGDGSPTSSGIIVPPASPGGYFTVEGNHTYAQDTQGTNESPYPISVAVQDAWGQQAVGTTSANVLQASISASNVAPVTAYQGVPLNNAIMATFTAGNPLEPMNDYTATVSWGDSSPDPTNATIVPLGGNTYAIEASHTYAQITSETATVVIYDEGRMNGIAMDTVNVGDAPIVATSTPAAAVAGTAYNGTIALFSTPNPAAIASDFTATIHWGNGDTTPGTIIPQSQGFAVTGGDYSYPVPGSYTATVTVAHNSPGTQTSQAFSTVSVADSSLSGVNVPEMNATAGTPFGGGDGRKVQRLEFLGNNGRLHGDDQLGRWLHAIGRDDRGARNHGGAVHRYRQPHVSSGHRHVGTVSRHGDDPRPVGRRKPLPPRPRAWRRLRPRSRLHRKSTRSLACRL